MDPQHIHAFVLKIWLERREIAGRQPEWRGRIDHVQSSQRKYFRDLADMTGFVASFLTLPNDTSSVEPANANDWPEPTWEPPDEANSDP
jgi:hypothetical protein